MKGKGESHPDLTQESARRREVVGYALGSVGLEGFRPTPQQLALFERYISCALSLDELIARSLESAEELGADEGCLASLRLVELAERPVQGDFGVEHLREVHRRVFQDLPQNHPGGFRPAARGHYKVRALESVRPRERYEVRYAGREAVDQNLPTVLACMGGAGGLRGLDKNAAAKRLAKLYGDLDYLHPFVEGNSRTLREFTRELAAKAGLRLDWPPGAQATPDVRDRLYRARDREVLQRAYPGLTEARAMETDSLQEYEAWFVLASLTKHVALHELLAAWLFFGQDRNG